MRELSSAIVSDGTGAAAQAAKFARSARVKSEEYQQRYRHKCRQIFEKQVRGACIGRLGHCSLPFVGVGEVCECTCLVSQKRCTFLGSLTTSSKAHFASSV